jgi:hypothetical protein
VPRSWPNNANVHRFAKYAQRRIRPRARPRARSVTSVFSVVKIDPSTPEGVRVGRARVFFTTEDTEVTEALGSLASDAAGLRIRYNLSFLVYEIQRLAARLLPQSLGTDRNDIQGQAVFLRVFASSR